MAVAIKFDTAMPQTAPLFLDRRFAQKQKICAEIMWSEAILTAYMYCSNRMTEAHTTLTEEEECTISVTPLLIQVRSGNERSQTFRLICDTDPPYYYVPWLNLPHVQQAIGNSVNMSLLLEQS